MKKILFLLALAFLGCQPSQLLVENTEESFNRKNPFQLLTQENSIGVYLTEIYVDINDVNEIHQNLKKRFPEVDVKVLVNGSNGDQTIIAMWYSNEPFAKARHQVGIPIAQTSKVTKTISYFGVATKKDRKRPDNIWWKFMKLEFAGRMNSSKLLTYENFEKELISNNPRIIDVVQMTGDYNIMVAIDIDNVHPSELNTIDINIGKYLHNSGMNVINIKDWICP